jgi:ATP-dependent Lhr-like helicase
MRAHALALQLLERYGVVTRETAAAEGLAGGFSAVYPVLKALEESGRVRRGYFIEGLGGAQFALPGAVDRLRAMRELPDEPVVRVLAATDPANPYGATLPWPRREDDARRPLARAAGARVVLIDGEPVLYIERGGRGLVTLPAFEDESAARLAIDAIRQQFTAANRASVDRIDGEPATQSPWFRLFREAGFQQGYRGLTWRPEREFARAGG